MNERGIFNENNPVKKLTKEQFDDKLFEVVKDGIERWERRRMIIANDKRFNINRYNIAVKNSGAVCDLCQARGEKDPMDMSSNFKALGEAWQTGDKEIILKSIDDSVAIAKEKAKKAFGREI